jgi:hypothetical protein
MSALGLPSRVKQSARIEPTLVQMLIVLLQPIENSSRSGANNCSDVAQCETKATAAAAHFVR